MNVADDGASIGGAAAIRAAALTFAGSPFELAAADAVRYESDALLVLEAGRIKTCGPAAALLPRLAPDVPVTHYRNALLVPGFVDTHVHYAQLPAIAAFGRTLLEWLDQHTFVVEQAFHDIAFARLTAEVFLDECLRQGITTAAVYGTVHPASVDAFCAAAEARGLRMIAGKVMMDRNAPSSLLDTARTAYDDSAALIGRWHGRARLGYAVTPRFAPTSTPEQLESAGALLREHPGVLLQTHLAETRDELAWVAALFPDAPDYLAVYERFGLVGPRSVFGHAIHLPDDAWARLHAAGAAVAHCPTSNNFLGSGHFHIGQALHPGRRVRLGLGSDVGGGTTLSMLGTMNEAYKVARHTGHALSATQAFWLATAGGAEALGLASHIGALRPGMEADFVVLDLAPTPLVSYRMQFCRDLEEALAVLIMLGDDRAVCATYAGGRPVHVSGARPPEATDTPPESTSG